MAQQEAIVVRLSTVAPDVACPLCGRLSGRVHSRYERTLTDLPWNRITVRLHLRTRKFFCDNGGCQRQVFTEPIPELAARYARKTARLSDTLLRLTYIVGGEAATRIARMLGLLVSPDGLLKHMKKQAAKRGPLTTPRAVGIDDFALRRGDRYGRAEKSRGYVRGAKRPDSYQYLSGSSSEIVSPSMKQLRKSAIRAASAQISS